MEQHGIHNQVDAHGGHDQDNGPDQIAIKFLLPNWQTGGLIGAGGSAIRELMEMTTARVVVSSIHNVYPGTGDRVALIHGSVNAVDDAQVFVWKMLALYGTAAPPPTGSNVKKNTPTWKPSEAVEKRNDFDDLLVSGKITVAAAAGGLILGKAGANLKAISEGSGAKIQMSAKEESSFTQERVLSISGTMAQCAKCVSLILEKLMEEPEAAQYVNRGVNYSIQHAGVLGKRNLMEEHPHLPHPHLVHGGRQPYIPNGALNGGIPGMPGMPMMQQARINEHGHLVNQFNEPLAATTTTVINISDALIGNIIGRQGSVLKEIMSLSGARVTISAREEPKNGDAGERAVSIVGTPSSAQYAHAMITQKIKRAVSKLSRDGDRRDHDDER